MAINDQDQEEPSEPNAIKLLKGAALEEKRVLDEIRQNLWSEHAQLFRWLTASLLAINSAAAFAILSAESLSPITKLISGGLFCLGILCSLLVGVLAQRSTQRVMPKIQEMVGYWIAVSIDGKRDEALEKVLLDQLQEKDLARVSMAFGWLSAILFAGGVVCVGLAITEGLIENEQSVVEYRDGNSVDQP